MLFIELKSKIVIWKGLLVGIGVWGLGRRLEGELGFDLGRGVGRVIYKR